MDTEALIALLFCETERASRSMKQIFLFFEISRFKRLLNQPSKKEEEKKSLSSAV